ncbi:hypothetical protein H0H92_009356 [Tricholoma furcatifolium]|nr:hypothetical protein H0H92_009356 [Tricholoma furcatifolium]
MPADRSDNGRERWHSSTRTMFYKSKDFVITGGNFQSVGGNVNTYHVSSKAQSKWSENAMNTVISRQRSPEPPNQLAPLRKAEDHLFQDENFKTMDLIQRIQATLENKQEYRKLLALRDVHAQGLLDMFQRLLDILTDDNTLSFRRNLIVATQRLAAASALYPISYELSNVTTPELPECSGSSAEIYKGDFRGRPVCVKTIRLHKYSEIDYFMKVVSKEAILWGQLQHPNLLPFYGIYRYKGRISLVAPWMENGVIGEYLRIHTAENRVVLAHDVAQGLKFLHTNGMIHGDLKGKNILVNDFGRACIADFGLSSISDKEILAWTSFSSAASKGGTSRYQAPELFDENGEQQSNTTSSDMYAWACVAYEIFAGEVPFVHMTRELAIMKHVSNGGKPTRPPDSSTSWSVWGLTEDIWTLMEACWDRRPTARPSVEAVANHLIVSLPPDIQKDASDYPLSPGQFREMIRGGLDDHENEISLEKFHSLIEGNQHDI